MTSLRRTLLSWLLLPGLLLAAESARTQPANGEKHTPQAQRVTFKTADKTPITLVAGYTPPADHGKARAPMAILLPMYNQKRATFDPLVPALHAAGFAVLALDMRGHGDSVEPESLKLAKRVEERDPRLFREMYRDVEAAYRWMTKQPGIDPSRFVLVGASVGCSVALDYAARDRSVDAVVCMTPGTDYLGIDSLASARKYGHRPLLLLTSEEERKASDELAGLVPSAQVRIVAAKPGTSEGKDALHGTRMFGRVQGIEAVMAKFLTDAAGSPGSSPVVASMIGEVYYTPGTPAADHLDPENLRVFSSAAEAEARGYRPPKKRSK